MCNNVQPHASINCRQWSTCCYQLVSLCRNRSCLFRVPHDNVSVWSHSDTSWASRTKGNKFWSNISEWKQDNGNDVDVVICTFLNCRLDFSHFILSGCSAESSETLPRSGRRVSSGLVEKCWTFIYFQFGQTSVSLLKFECILNVKLNHFYWNKNDFLI